MIDSAKDIIQAFAEKDNEAPRKYPGVTSILKATKPYSSGLEEWVAREGQAEATRIFEEAQRFGSSLDAIVNDHLSLPNFTRDDYKKEIGFQLFRQLEPLLGRVVPYAVQLRLWSERLEARGILDCVGLFDGELSLIDIKNSRNLKREEWIEDYFLQCTMYSMMIYDLMAVEVKQIVLLIAVRGENSPQVFVKKTKDYVKPVLRRVSQYRTALATN